ncbi:MAG: hypothetical protein KTR35_09480 [Gammaproteobacteria bacterium]|nr:hypothetical protein [Gammaproteobacteria bacterium]
MSKIVDSPINSGVPYWWEDGAPLPNLSNELPANAQLLIVGLETQVTRLPICRK